MSVTESFVTMGYRLFLVILAREVQNETVTMKSLQNRHHMLLKIIAEHENNLFFPEIQRYTLLLDDYEARL